MNPILYLMKQHADDQGCPLIISGGDWKGIYCRHYTLQIQTHIPSFRRLSPIFHVDKIPVFSSSGHPGSTNCLVPKVITSTFH